MLCAQSHGTSTREPVSLIMTVLNEESSLRTFLASLNGQSRLPDELVVVDGGSKDRTIAILREWSEQGSVPLTLIQADGASIARGRNLAAEAAKHAILAIADGGTTLFPNWLDDLSHVIEEGADVAAGFFEPVGSTVFEKSLATIITPHISEVKPDKFLPSSRSLAVRKKVFIDAGGYPEWLDYCEDLVFDLAMLKNGATQKFVPSARVTWAARPDLASFAKQYYRYARGDGKANLFAKRHLMRYAAYGALACAISGKQRRAWLLGPVSAVFAIHLGKFWIRIYEFRNDLGSNFPAAIAMVPLIVVVGDLAKMAGYPVGLIQRFTREFK